MPVRVDTSLGPVQFNERSHRYKLNGDFVPSDSAIAKIADSGPPPQWGERNALKGVCALRAEGLDADTPEGWLHLLKEHQLSVNDRRDTAGLRGTILHDLIPPWANHQKVPTPADHPEDYRPFIQALAGWLSDEQPAFLATEVIVASKKYRFAGRYDARCRIRDEDVLVDFKTSRYIYDHFHYQLAGYELAAVECGATPTDYRLIVRLGEDGEYEPEIVVATAEDFICARDMYDSQKGVGKRRREQKKLMQDNDKLAKREEDGAEELAA